MDFKFLPSDTIRADPPIHTSIISQSLYICKVPVVGIHVEALPNSIRRKHPRKREKKKQGARTKVQAGKQLKRREENHRSHSSCFNVKISNYLFASWDPVEPAPTWVGIFTFVE
jgi:hypothetical protein